MRRASVAVVIPAFNESATIERVVRSVVAEPWHNEISLLSVIVVDDRSDDATGTIACGLAVEAPVVQALRHTVRRGKNAAINTGLAKARTSGVDVAVVLDADVRLRPGAVVRTVSLLLDNPHLGATSCVNEPLSPRSWREWPSAFQARMLVEVARTGHGPLQRLFALRLPLLAGMELPDTTHDDLYLSRWLHRAAYGIATEPTAVIQVRAATGFRDFAKQTLRTREAVGALDAILPAAASLSATRGLLLTDVAKAARRDPIGAAIYSAWLALVLVTPRRWWLPAVNHTKYDQSASTKALD